MSSPPTLLVIDDEPSILRAFRRVFSQPDWNVITAETGTTGLDNFQESKPDLVIMDVGLPDMQGLAVFDQIRHRDPATPVVFITGHGTTESAIEAIKRGAVDYLFKPLELDELRAVVSKALRLRLPSAATTVSPQTSGNEPLTDVLVGRSPVMKEIYKSIGRVTSQNVTVLISGESGTGKELVARAIYQHSDRSGGPFLAINCAAIPDSILESELFGHEQGAFTGAERQRIGKFEQCSGGTLFLDEVGDMSPTTQTKILRILEEQRFERLGGNETIQTDARLIAATNHDLGKLVAEGVFREDLYFRLSVFSIVLPPLRDRGEDLDLSVLHLLERFAHELHKGVFQVSDETMGLLRNYTWPGNVRELQSAI